VPGVEPSVIATDADPALIGAVHKVFPNAVALLCLWHIQKNVAKHCKAGFATDEAWKAFEKEYNAVFYAKTEQDYEDQLQQFSINYAFEKHLWFIDDYVGYIKSTWLTPIRKTQCVQAWTDQHLHFGTTVTS
jgi:predicted HNH restriction endonuclease